MNSKNTKRALLGSVVAMLVCFTMLLSTTFAWFTDTAVSASNKIVAGTLKVDLEILKDGAWTSIKDSNAPIFDYEKWEPGYTEAKVLKIENEGSLALKWYATFSSEKALSELANVIDVFVCPSATEIGVPAGRDLTGYTKVGTLAEFLNTIETTTYGVLYADGTAGDEAYLGIALQMQETAGNEYQGKDLGGKFDITILATQLNYESDSFDENYDKDALYPVANAAELATALADGKDVILGEDIVLNDAPIVVAANAAQVIDLNGNTLSGISTSSTSSNLIKVPASSTLTLTNGTVSFGATTPDTNWGGVGQPAFPGYANNTINCSGTLIIDGATIENVTAPGGASYAIDCYPGANLIINNGVIDGHGKVAIRMFANSATDATNVTINGGTITGRRGIWVQLPSSNSAVAPIVNLTVNGGTITATDVNDCAIYSYSYGNSFANTNVTITGGTFNGVVGFGGGYKGDQETVTVTGGTFNDGIGRYLAGDGWEDITVQ